MAHTFVKDSHKSPSFSSCLWTALALRTLVYPGTVDCASYLTKYSEGFVNLKGQPCSGLATETSFWKQDFKVKIWEVIPAGISFYNSYCKSPMQTHRPGFMDEFFPINILNWNISSNDGLNKTLSHLYAYNEGSVLNRKIILKVGQVLPLIHIIGGSEHILQDHGQLFH